MLLLSHLEREGRRRKGCEQEEWVEYLESLPCISVAVLVLVIVVGNCSSTEAWSAGHLAVIHNVGD